MSISSVSSSYATFAIPLSTTSQNFPSSSMLQTVSQQLIKPNLTPP